MRINQLLEFRVMLECCDCVCMLSIKFSKNIDLTFNMTQKLIITLSIQIILTKISYF